MHFLITSLVLLFFGVNSINTVKGPMPVSSMGPTLIHEHFLVDFIGADKINYGRWDRKQVLQKLIPLVREVQKLGIRTIFDNTPAYLGRDPLLLKALSDSTGLQIVTNTGLYGAVDNKYLPAYAFSETARQLADRWISEWDQGIEGTGIRPGFMKISVNDSLLTPLHRKLVEAAALTHLTTGLTICSHTGPALAAFDEIAVLQKMGVDPSAFVWVHAQAEKNIDLIIKAAKMGAWISLDGMGWGEITEYLPKIAAIKRAGLLQKLLISHDAGWYKPGEPDGCEINGYTNIHLKLLPALRNIGFSQKELDTLLILNPSIAYNPVIRRRAQ